ncbi:MAG: hypothetical protein U1E05_13785 [Patescibacteria group bacterium]|nr:hypothetical protein [Patescibacteria group bacterium]
MNRIIVACWLLLSPLMIGCSDDGLNAVSGIVSLDDQPIPNGAIEFLPADGKGPTAAAVIEGGRYQARVAPGRKEVRIVGYRKTGERHVVPGDPSSPMMDMQEQVVPAKYNTASELRCDVAPGRGVHDFELRTR